MVAAFGELLRADGPAKQSLRGCRVACCGLDDGGDRQSCPGYGWLAPQVLHQPACGEAACPLMLGHQGLVLRSKFSDQVAQSLEGRRGMVRESFGDGRPYPCARKRRVGDSDGDGDGRCLQEALRRGDGIRRGLEQGIKVRRTSRIAGHDLGGGGHGHWAHSRIGELQDQLTEHCRPLVPGHVQVHVDAGTGEQEESWVFL